MYKIERARRQANAREIWHYAYSVARYNARHFPGQETGLPFEHRFMWDARPCGIEFLLMAKDVVRTRNIPDPLILRSKVTLGEAA